MRVFTRYNLVDGNDSPDDELLLEGSWPRDKNRPGRWSLDDAIDARFIWIDQTAMELAERAGSSSLGLGFAYINALALRYYLVKLLRVIAFFQDVQPLKEGGRLTLHAAGGDEDYVELFQQLAAAQGLKLIIRRRQTTSAPMAAARRQPPWRHWAARASQRRRWPPGADGNTAPRVVLCGNPHVLNPVCAELLSRGARVGWLYERFAVRSWWRWRTAGVEQLICETGRRGKSSFSDVACNEPLMVEGVDLTRPVNHWLAWRAREAGEHQSLLVEQVETHFRRVRPTAIILDEDATPLKRIAVALGRSYGAASILVQHGAPCGPFGFLPLAADRIAVWGDVASRQLRRWGLSLDRIHTAGWPKIKNVSASSTVGRPSRPSNAKRFLLLATMPPRDKRPDNVEFHLTSGNYRRMLDMVYQVLRRIDGAKLTIKLHPRDARTTTWPFPPEPVAAADGRGLPIKIVRTSNLSKLIAQSDCVLSCASTAGIEAALAGAPVVQLLPDGSGNILPAGDWGLLGSARNVDELTRLVDEALSRGWRQGQATAQVLAAQGSAAAAQVVDAVFEQCRRDEQMMVAVANDGGSE